MKIRNTGRRSGEKVELQMTPMIDIVFQLLIFFIMTFKIVAIEGDFSIKMPSAAPTSGVPDPLQDTPLKLTLKANDDGTLASIRLDERSFDSMDELGIFIISNYGSDSPHSLRDAVEIELDCDAHLHYAHTMNAITHVIGYVDRSSGKTIPLIEKIKFSPPKK